MEGWRWSGRGGAAVLRLLPAGTGTRDTAKPSGSDTRAQSGAVLGSYGQSGCARRSGKAWGALRGETGRSQLGKGAGEPGLSPGGAAELLLRLRAGSTFTSISSLAGDIRAVLCHTCASPWPRPSARHHGLRAGRQAPLAICF